MSKQKKGQEVEMTAKQMSYEIQKLMKTLGPEEFLKVFEKSLLGWIKAIPAEKRKQKLLQDLYPTLPLSVQELLTQETGFSLACPADQA